MAGEWIKFEINTLEKPEVMRIARLLNIEQSAVIGSLVRFWIWANRNSVDGAVDGVVAADVDTMLTRPGFARAMEQVHWLQCDDQKQRITIPKFDRHNGDSAKKRALKNERQARWRSNSVDGHVDGKASTGASTREEKRRSNTPLPPSGAFQRFWDSWPASERKEAKGKCAELWAKGNFDSLAGEIIAHVEACKQTERWRAGFICAPKVYLGNRRWEGAQMPATQPGASW